MCASFASRRLPKLENNSASSGKKKMIKCEKCGVEKDESDLHRIPSGPYFKMVCLECRKARIERLSNTRNTAQAKIVAWRAKNREKLNLNQILKKFNLTKEQYASLIDRQNGCCAICDSKVPLAVDHCHATGKIRGLLCRSCNTALGMLKENPYIFERAADYVKTGGIL